MSKTKRRKAWRLFNREQKPYRKAHHRAYRHSVSTLTRIIAQSSTDISLPRYRKTSGWLSW